MNGLPHFWVREIEKNERYSNKKSNFHVPRLWFSGLKYWISPALSNSPGTLLTFSMFSLPYFFFLWDSTEPGICHLKRQKPTFVLALPNCILSPDLYSRYSICGRALSSSHHSFYPINAFLTLHSYFSPSTLPLLTILHTMPCLLKCAVYNHLTFIPPIITSTHHVSKSCLQASYLKP